MHRVFADDLDDADESASERLVGEETLAIAKAVRELALLRKTDPAAYRALIDRYAGQEIRIVPG